jgi:hypothetical protein
MTARKSKELVVIPERDERPWYERVWNPLLPDGEALDPWTTRVFEALRNRNPATLTSLLRQLMVEEPKMAAPDGRLTRPTHVFLFAPDIMRAYTPLIGRRV